MNYLWERYTLTFLRNFLLHEEVYKEMFFGSRCHAFCYFKMC